MLHLSNFSFLLEECEVIFAEVPADPDLNTGPGLGDESLGVPGLHSLVDPDGGEAGGPGVSVEESGHQGARVSGGPEDNLRGEMTLTLASADSVDLQTAGLMWLFAQKSHTNC